MPFFMIKGLSQGLDGLIVEATSPEDQSLLGLLEIRRIINANVMMGDRTLSFPVTELGLYVDTEHLEAISDPGLREFAHDNPWGKCLFEGRYVKESLEIAYARYEKATQATVTEKQGKKSKTLFTGYFLSGDTEFEDVKDTIEQCLVNGDADDLIFELKQLQTEGED
jgi:hypothetical protein